MKKMKKSIIYVMCVTLSTFVFWSCGGGSGSEGLGKWEITEATGEYADMNIGTIYDFKDTTMTMTKGLMTSEATYKISGDTIIQTIGSISVKFLYKIEGDKMTYQTVGTDQVFTMKKK